MSALPRRGPFHHRGSRLASIAVLLSTGALSSDDAQPLTPEVEALLPRSVLTPEHTRQETSAFVRSRLPKLEVPNSVEAWEREAARLRDELRRRLVRRGAAADWETATLGVRRLGPLGEGPGYRLDALLYEAVPGMWIPALVYWPVPLRGPAPVMIAFTGHEPEGFATKQIQLRSINLAQRGVVVLAPEWLGQGNLQTDGFFHEQAAYLDLLGTPGVSIFHQLAHRAVDVALSLDGVDPRRVGVSGLSGGGWQSLLIGALDQRVSLINSVAGFSTFSTRLDHFGDLGDYEQLPADLGLFADYDHLTALLAPRPTLLGFNALDDCCFAAGHALPPVQESAGAVFRLVDPKRPLRIHIDPTTPSHNFDRAHREALYQLLREAWSLDGPGFATEEADLSGELRTREELRIPLPEGNLDLHGLARKLAAELLGESEAHEEVRHGSTWPASKRATLRTTLRLSDALPFRATLVGEDREGSVRAQDWKLGLGTESGAPRWTVPITLFEAGSTHETVVLVGDGGRNAMAGDIAFELSRGRRVLAVDPFLLGETRVDRKAYRFALFVSTVGARALGVQVEQLQAVARWAKSLPRAGSIELKSVGPRSSVSAMLSAALDPELYSALRLIRPLGSFAGLIDRKVSVADMPELFCVDLLATTEVSGILRLLAPRPSIIEAPPAELPPIEVAPTRSRPARPRRGG